MTALSCSLFFAFSLVGGALARQANPWNEFQKANAGKGWSRQQMKEQYRSSDAGFFGIVKSIFGVIPGLENIKTCMDLYDTMDKWMHGDPTDALREEVHGIRQEIAGYRKDQFYLGIAQLVLPLLTRALEAQFKESGSQDPTELDAMRYARSLVLTSFEENSFEAVHGHTAAKQELQKAVKYPILNPELFQGLRAPHRGIILVGPPGNGKTLLAKALAAEVKAPFIFCSPSDFRSMMHGVSEARIKAVFQLARSLAAAGSPVIIFVDELDGISDNRLNGGIKGGGQSLLSQLLVELDGFMSRSDDHIFVLGATNLLEQVDPALKREGRFDLKIPIPPPNETERINFFKQLLQETRHNLDNHAFEGIASEECTGGFPYVTLRTMAAFAAKSALPDFTKMTEHEIRHLEIHHVRDIAVDDVLTSLKFIESRDQEKDARVSQLLKELVPEAAGNARMSKQSLRTNYDACSLHLQTRLLSKGVVHLTEENVESKCGIASKAFCVILLSSGSNREDLNTFAKLREDTRLKNSNGGPIELTWCTTKAHTSWTELARVLLVRKSHALGLVLAETNLNTLPKDLEKFVEGTLPLDFWSKLQENGVELPDILARVQEKARKASRRKEL